MAGKRKTLTPMQEAFLTALMSDECKGDFRAAMNAAGYSKSYHPGKLIADLKDEIIERAELILAKNAPKAALAVTGILDDPTAIGNKMRMDAAKDVLDRAGLSKQERVTINTDEKNAIFVLPAKAPIKLVEKTEEMEYNSGSDDE